MVTAFPGLSQPAWPPPGRAATGPGRTWLRSLQQRRLLGVPGAPARSPRGGPGAGTVPAAAAFVSTSAHPVWRAQASWKALLARPIQIRLSDTPDRAGARGRSGPTQEERELAAEAARH